MTMSPRVVSSRTAIVELSGLCRWSEKKIEFSTPILEEMKNLNILESHEMSFATGQIKNHYWKIWTRRRQPLKSADRLKSLPLRLCQQVNNHLPSASVSATMHSKLICTLLAAALPMRPVWHNIWTKKRMNEFLQVLGTATPIEFSKVCQNKSTIPKTRNQPIFGAVTTKIGWAFVELKIKYFPQQNSEPVL